MALEAVLEEHVHLARGVEPPADERSVRLEPARVIGAGCDLDEEAARRAALTIAVVAPAGDCPGRSQAAAVMCAGGDLREGAGGERSGLEGGVAPPAGERPIGLQPARVQGAHCDLRER